MKTFADNVLAFYKSLRITAKLPVGVEVLNPYQYKETFALCEQFYHTYYHDQQKRKLILGINPGRFGAGLTGIPFTDPVKLAEKCGIPNPLPKKAELSADFIHRMIDAYGGLEKFFSQYYISSVSPLGFTQNGKNLNYYDLKELQESLHEFFMKTIEEQLQFGIERHVCYCLGEGKNYAFIDKLNKKMNWFDQVIPLPHPRFIMQYRRKQIDTYLQHYVSTLR